MVSSGRWFRAGLAVLSVAFIAGPALALPSTKIGTAPLQSPTSADAYYGGATTATNGTGAIGRSKEIVELARALKRDPDLIYEHIRNNVTTSWTYGLSKGAVGAIIDRSGTAFDQAQLLVELLRESGFTAEYKLGTITLTGTQFQAWTGLTSATATCQLLSSGGIPAAVNGSTTANCAYGSATVSTVELSHAWVSVVIGGVSYVYDPAYKDHSFKTGVSLATATGMPAGMAMAITASSGTSGGVPVPYVNSYAATTLNSNLTTYANNLEAYIDANVASGGMADVVGGKTINAQAISSSGLRQLTLPYTANVLRTISGELPDQYRTKLRVQITKARPDTSTPTVIDKTLYGDEVYGRRLTFEPNFDTSGASFTGALKLTDDLGSVLTLSSTSYADNPSFSRGVITLTLTMPYAANSGGYMDTVVTRNVSYALPFTIVTGFGETGRGFIDKWGQRRDSVMPAVPDATCKVCFVSYKSWKGDGRRETLAAAWLAQATRAGQLNAAIGKGIFAHHYAIGISSADTTVFNTANGAWWVTDSFDRLDVESGISLTSATATAVDRNAAVLSAASSMVALKGSVSAQISDLPEASSVPARLEWGNAPPSGAGTSRRFYKFTTTSETAQALAMSLADNGTTAGANGDPHGDVAAPHLGPTEVASRRQAVADAVTAYVAAGFGVTSSNEGFLGPGRRAAGFTPASGGQYTHAPTPQRGGAMVAIKNDANGDPVEVAYALISPQGVIDAGGGGAQTFHQTQYDPATSADVVKGRFIQQPIGTVIVASPAKVSVGQGEFPYSLTAGLTWRGGPLRDETHGPGAHREPQGGWTTNFTNTFTLSGSGLEAMGESDPRAATGAITAFYAAQDTYKSAWSAKRELAGQLIQAWWLSTLRQNVATAAIGTETRQWLRKPNGQWLTPGAATYGKLMQTGAPTIVQTIPNGHSACPANILAYVPASGWSYTGVSFKVTGGKGDEQVFADWTNQVVGDVSATPKCGIQRGFRLTGWSWLKGVGLNLAYARPGGYTEQIESLASVNNNLGKWIRFTDGGWGGFYASNAANANLMATTASMTGAQVTHTDAASSATKFDILTLGSGDFARQVMDKVYAADSTTEPASTYVYDTLARVAQMKDRPALVGSRAPTQYFLADGLRSEILNAAGYSSIVYADRDGRPVRTLDGAGAISTVAYDGRGRPILTTSPDGDRTQIEYNARNLPTKTTRLARVGSAEAGQTNINETGWHATLDVPAWTKDPKGAQTDYTYNSYGEVTKVQLPPAYSGATRDEANQYYYGDGQSMAVTTAMGRNLAKTYTNGTSWQSLTDTVESTSGVTNALDYSPLGDPLKVVGPLGGVTNVTYDALRRPTLILEPQASGLMFCNQPNGGNGCMSVYSSPNYTHPQVIDPNVSRVGRRVTYDTLGRAWKVERGTSLNGVFTVLETYTSEFDAAGNRIKQTGPAGVIQMSYDALNRPVCTAVRMNADVYSALPSDACQPSAAGKFGPDRISRVNYDAAGRVTHQEAGVGSALQQVTARLGYSAGGQRTSLTDANGNTSVFEYDGFGRLKKLRYPASPRGSGQASTTDYEEYGYDANGNRTSFRKRSGQTIAYSYDALNRQTVIDLPGTTADDVYYSYLLNGRQVEGRLGSASATDFWRMDFDQAGRLKYDASQGSVGRNGYNAYYNAAGQLTEAYFGNGNYSRFFYSYDLAGRLNEVRQLKEIWPQVTVSRLTFAYDALNRRTAINRPNGVNTTYAYDAAGRLSGLSHAAPTVTAGFYQSFGYNPAGQLIANDQASDQYVWSGQPTTTTNFTHDQLNRDAAIAAASGYDANGNLTADGTRTFTYDVLNRLRAVSGGPASITFDYDPFGRLANYVTGGATTHLRYAGPNLAAEYAGTNSWHMRSYLSGPGVDQWWLWLEGNDQNAVPKWFAQDRLGSVISVSDASGAVTPYTYGPYGEPQSWAGSRFRYTGQMAIPEAQIYHYRARAYDPVMGRFLQTDPIGYGDGPNMYAYVGGDPLNFTDPSGRCAGVAFGDSSGTCVAEVVVTSSRRIGVDYVTFYSAGNLSMPALDGLNLSIQMAAIDWKKVLEVCRACLDLLGTLDGKPPEIEDIPDRGQQQPAPNKPGEEGKPGTTPPGNKPTSPGNNPPPVVIPRPPVSTLPNPPPTPDTSSPSGPAPSGPAPSGPTSGGPNPTPPSSERLPFWWPLIFPPFPNPHNVW